MKFSSSFGNGDFGEDTLEIPVLQLNRVLARFDTPLVATHQLDSILGNLLAIISEGKNISVPLKTTVIFKVN